VIPAKRATNGRNKTVAIYRTLKPCAERIISETLLLRLANVVEQRVVVVYLKYKAIIIAQILRVLYVVTESCVAASK